MTAAIKAYAIDFGIIRTPLVVTDDVSPTLPWLAGLELTVKPAHREASTFRAVNELRAGLVFSPTSNLMRLMHGKGR
jgi:hypothetical protein